MPNTMSDYPGFDTTEPPEFEEDNGYIAHLEATAPNEIGDDRMIDYDHAWKLFTKGRGTENNDRKIIKNFKIKGSCNIQSIVDKKGKITPFEGNCRISGTNSIRSQFGFEDVKYTIEEYLFNKKPKKPIIKKGAAVRILMDVIYPGIGLNKIKNKSTKHYMF